MPTAPLQSLWTASWKGVLRILYPPLCVGCGCRVGDDALPLCPGCMRGLDRPTTEDCRERLDRLEAAPAVFDDAFALWVFDAGGPLQALQHRLKYGNRPHYGLQLGHIMATAYRQARLPLPDVVVPVPLHRTRLYERGYNQSALLAQGLSDGLDVRFRDDVLERRAATRSQTRLSRAERWKNVAEAFFLVRPEDVAGKHVLLVDDLLTTGATATAAGAALRRAGPSRVSLATLGLVRE